MKSKLTVGQSLFLLISIQIIGTLLIIFFSVYILRSVISDSDRLYNFQFVAVSEIAKVIEETAELQSINNPYFKENSDEPKSFSSILNHIEHFYAQYKKQWETASGDSPNARVFRKKLMQHGRTDLINTETTSLKRLRHAIDELRIEYEKGLNAPPSIKRWKKTIQIRRELFTLLDLNIQFAKFDNDIVSQRALRLFNLLLFLCGFGFIFAGSVALYIHNTISPRIRRLANKVERFKENGVIEKINEFGKDEISVLGNAIDAGFHAISERDRERSHFLAIAAHEIKTPITSIQGYSSMLLAHRDQPKILDRALETINRQSWRLSRLTEDLFLAMQAKEKNLHFKPNLFDLSDLIVRVVNEIKPIVPSRPISQNIQPHVKVIGDEALIEHAVWSLINCATALSNKNCEISIKLETEPLVSRILIGFQDPDINIEEIEALFTPFRSIQYESNSGIRTVVGLYLSREILKLHNGALRLKEREKGVPEFIVELSA